MTEIATEDKHKEAEIRVPWLDAWIRWERQQEEIEVDNDAAPTNPEGPETFTFDFHNDYPSIEVKGFPLDSEQIWNSTGLTMWPAAQLLGTYLVAHPDLMLESDTILEVGSGLGLCGILAYQIMKTSKVIDSKEDERAKFYSTQTLFLTDGDTDTLQQLERNVESNLGPGKDASTLDEDQRNDSAEKSSTRHPGLSCHQLLWGQEQAKAFCSRHGRCQVIFGSDLLYSDRAVPLLIKETIPNLLDRKGIFIMGHCHRRKGSSVTVEMILAAADEAGLYYERVDEQEDKGSDEVYIYIFRLANDS